MSDKKELNFEEAMEIEGAIKYYFGDSVSDITYGKIIEEDVSTETELPLKGNYRLEYIYHIQRGELPASEGLAVEKRADDGTYYVITFIRYDSKEKSAYFDVVSKRLINVEETEWPDVLELMKIGTRIVEPNIANTCWIESGTHSFSGGLSAGPYFTVELIFFINTPGASFYPISKAYLIA